MAYEFRTRTLRSTPAQRRLADSLGLTYPPKVTFGTLGDLIKQAQAAAQPTQEQTRLSEFFGVEIAAGMTSGELNRRLLPMVRKHAVSAMQANPALRAGKVIQFQQELYEIVFIGGVDNRYVADLKAFGMAGLHRTRQVLIMDIADVQAIKQDVALTMFNPRRRPALMH